MCAWRRREKSHEEAGTTASEQLKGTQYSVSLAECRLSDCDHLLMTKAKKVSLQKNIRKTPPRKPAITNLVHIQSCTRPFSTPQ